MPPKTPETINDDFHILAICDIGIGMAEPKTLMKVPHRLTRHFHHGGGDGLAAGVCRLGGHDANYIHERPLSSGQIPRLPFVCFL